MNRNYSLLQISQRWFKHGTKRRRRHGSAVTRRPTTLSLEALEDRLLLSASIIGLGADTTAAYAINNSGDVAGVAQGSGITQGFVYTPSSTSNGPGTTMFLGTLGGFSSNACGINDSGQVVGTVNLKDGSIHAFLYSSNIPNSQPRDLGTVLPGLSTAGGPDVNINNGGAVVGEDSNGEAFLETISGMSQLIPNNLATASAAQGINSAGQIVGLVEASNGNQHAALFTGNGSYQDLGALVYEEMGDPYSAANAINASGQVVGVSNSDSSGFGTNHAFLYSNGQVTSLGALVAGGNSGANGINSAGWVVGQSDTASTALHAVVWENGTPIDLNTLLPQNSGWVLTDAYAINDASQIVGSGLLNGVPQAFLLNLSQSSSPVSPPSSPPSWASPPPPPQQPQNPTPPPTPWQLLLDGVTLAIDLSERGGLSAVMANAGLVHDIETAPGGLFNPFLDAGFSAVESMLQRNTHS